jgi:Uma2 family endonuclease
MKSQEGDLFQKLIESPDAVLVMNRFQEYLKTESQKRKEFYDLVHEDMKAEFINGEIVLHSPVRMKHWLVSSNIAFELTSFVKKHQLGVIGVEKVMIELSRNNYEPDIVFFRKEIANAFKDEQKLFPAPDLAVEILSESTRKNDYGIKFQDYEAHNVGEYWIVDPENAIIEQFVLLEGKFYLHNKLEKKGVLTSLIVAGFQIDIEKIFG